MSDEIGEDSWRIGESFFFFESCKKYIGVVSVFFCYGSFEYGIVLDGWFKMGLIRRNCKFLICMKKNCYLFL